MNKLNEKAKEQIEEVLKNKGGICEHRRIVLQQNLKDTANGLIQRIRKFAPCFTLYLYEALCREINPYTRVIACRWYNPKDDICQKGLDLNRCGDCTPYEPEDSKLTDEFDCNHCPFNSKPDAHC